MGGDKFWPAQLAREEGDVQTYHGRKLLSNHLWRCSLCEPDVVSFTLISWGMVVAVIQILVGLGHGSKKVFGNDQLVLRHQLRVNIIMALHQILKSDKQTIGNQ